MFCMVKKKIYILSMLQNITEIVKNNYSFNDSERRGQALSNRKKLSALLRRITSKHHGHF